MVKLDKSIVYILDAVFTVDLQAN